jgi:hypothetical protein
MSEDKELREEGEIREDYRTGDAAEEPLEQDRDDALDEIEEAASEARTSDPRIAEPPG